MSFKQYIKHKSNVAINTSIEKFIQLYLYDINIIQDNIKKILDQLYSKKHLDSYLVEDEDILTSKTNYVKHGLSRKWTGYKIINKSAQADIWTDTTATTDDTIFLPLKCSADVTISIEVF